MPVYGIPLSLENMMNGLLVENDLSSWNIFGGQKSVVLTLRFQIDQNGGPNMHTHRPSKTQSYRKKPTSQVTRDTNRIQTWKEQKRDQEYKSIQEYESEKCDSDRNVQLQSTCMENEAGVHSHTHNMDIADSVTPVVLHTGSSMCTDSKLRYNAPIFSPIPQLDSGIYEDRWVFQDSDSSVCGVTTESKDIQVEAQVHVDCSSNITDNGYGHVPDITSDNTCMSSVPLAGFDNILDSYESIQDVNTLEGANYKQSPETSIAQIATDDETMDSIHDDKHSPVVDNDSMSDNDCTTDMPCDTSHVDPPYLDTFIDSDNPSDNNDYDPDHELNFTMKDHNIHDQSMNKHSLENVQDNQNNQSKVISRSEALSMIKSWNGIDPIQDQILSPQ